MKLLWITLLTLFCMPTATAQNDCVDALYVCGNSNFSGLTATGFGIQEIDIDNACTSVEHNTLWFKIKIKTGGTLGLVIAPASSDLEVDLDFWIYGPGTSCSNLGPTVRCSTTNPLMAHLTHNLTGMNDTATEDSEGPGEDGDSFIRQLDVLDNEEYYLVVDRPIGESDFSVTWTGTATFYQVPVFNNPEGSDTDFHHCDDDGTDDASIMWDLTVHKAMFIGSQDDVALTYHLNLNDVTTGTHALEHPEAFANTAPQQTLYMRMTNIVTGCFSTQPFRVVIDPLPQLPLPQPDPIMLCDFGKNGYRLFDIGQHTQLLLEGYPGGTVAYYQSAADAQNEVSPLSSVYVNTIPYATQTLYARMNHADFCSGYGIASFQVGIIPIPVIDYAVSFTDWTFNSNSITIAATGDPTYFEYSLNGGAYSPSGNFTGLEAGVYEITIRTTDGCAVTSTSVVLLNYPKFFTPNNDGTNDRWHIPYLRFFPGATVTVFDRYGKVVSVIGATDAGWDGTYNGRRLPSTDYWFTADLKNGRVLRGHFAMLR